MPEISSDLQFDRAAYSGGGGTGASPCGICKEPLHGEYWKWQNLLACSNCRPKLVASLARSQSAASFLKAFLFGGLTALGGGIAYALFVGLSHWQIGIITIGIAFVVAKVVRWASGGLGGRRFQVLAVMLTYVAATMGYLPGLISGFATLSDKAKTPPATAQRPTNAPKDVEGGDEGENETKELPVSGGSPTKGDTNLGSVAPRSVGGVLAGLLFIFAIMLATPFITITTGPIGTFIVAISLWEAWRLTRGVSLKIDGPFQFAAPSPAQATS